MVWPIQQRQRLDGSADGDGDHNNSVVIPGALTLSGTAAVIRNIQSMNIVTPIRQQWPAAAADSSPLFKDEEVANSSPTPFDNGNDDYYEDNSVTSPLRSFAKSLWVSPKPTYTDVPDDVATPTTPTLTHDHDRASSSCSTVNHTYDVYEDNDNDEPQSLIKTKVDESDITKRSESDERCLPEDTFSFFVYSDVLRSRTFNLALFVFFFQMGIYFILAYDITSVLSNKKNPLKLPVNVEIPVRIAEFFAIMVAIITQDEVRTAVTLIRDGFDEDLVEAFPGTTKAKWGWSIALRAFEGLCGLLLTCLLVMQSTTVLDLLLNFLAMEFVSQLDDVVFLLAREGFLGFLGRVLKDEAKNVSNTYYVSQHSRKSRKNATCVTNVYFLVLFTSMFTGYGIIVTNQNSGVYLCSKIFAQHGDEALPKLGSMSGLFLLQKQFFHLRNRRLGYKDDRGSLLAYCNEEKRWTLSLPPKDSVSPDDWNPCDWYAASSESEDFDVLKTATSQWVVKTSTNIFVPLSQHFLACYDCTDNLCGPNGKCNDNFECECKTGHYGLRCEYPEPCQRLEMEIEQHDEGFVKTGESYFASKYYRLQDVETYNRPVYISLGDNQTTLSDDTDFFVFTGVRWILSYRRLFPELKDVNNTIRLAEYFKTQFNGHSTNYRASYVSEPVYIDTPADAKASPLSVRWRYSALDNDQQLRPDLQKGFIETSFFCAYCDEGKNPCPQGAACLSDGTCGGCPNDSSGTMCQIQSKFISNGQCDSQFNNITFGFDGGDCCENTCRSTPENTCGKAGQGYIDTGYPLCVNASNQWELSGGPIDGVSSGSRLGVAVALSGKGKILAVADAAISIVRLFDKKGSKWIERGQVQGPPESNFGLAIGLSHESYNITSNPSTYPTVTLAVGAPKLGLVRVFKCSTTGCIQRGHDIVGSGGFGNSLSISKDGNSIAIGGADRESSIFPNGNNNDEDVGLFTWSNNTNDWQEKGNVTIDTPWSGQSDPPYQFGLRGYYVSLSGDYLAVGTLKGEVTPVPRFESVNLITQVYKWNESNTGWNQLGDEIKQKFYDDASFGDPWPLKSVVIKGHTLAIGSNSSVSVYEWNEASSKWTPREIELKGSEVKGLVGWSVDLSEDANILAVGVSVENPLPTDESIRMYKWDGKRYNALFNGVPGGPAAYVSLSSDGRAVAVGLPFDASNGGSTTVYSFYPSSPCEDPSEMPLRISFTTDGRPEETKWELQVDSEVKRSSGSLSGYMHTTFVEEMCIPETSCVKFTVYDTQGDGLSPPGVFSLMLNGTEVAQGGNFEFFHVTSVGNCECSHDEAKFTLATWSNFKPVHWSLINQNTLKPYTGLKLVPSEKSFFTVVDECIPKDCYYLTSQKDSGDDNDCTVVYSAVYNGESILPSSKYGHVFCNLSRYEFGEC